MPVVRGRAVAVRVGVVGQGRSGQKEAEHRDGGEDEAKAMRAIQGRNSCVGYMAECKGLNARG